MNNRTKKHKTEIVSHARGVLLDESEEKRSSSNRLPNFETLIPYRDRAMERQLNSLLYNYEEIVPSDTPQHPVNFQNLIGNHLNELGEMPRSFMTPEAFMKIIKPKAYPPVLGIFLSSEDIHQELNSQSENAENLLSLHHINTGTNLKGKYLTSGIDHADVEIISNEKTAAEFGISALKSTRGIEDCTVDDDSSTSSEPPKSKPRVKLHPEPLLTAKIVKLAIESQDLMDIIRYFKLQPVLNADPLKIANRVKNEYSLPAPKSRKDTLKREMIVDCEEKLEYFLLSNSRALHALVNEPSKKFLQQTDCDLDRAEGVGSHMSISNDSEIDWKIEEPADGKKLKRSNSLDCDTPAMTAFCDIPVVKGTNIKNHICVSCKSEFSQKGHLNRHIKQVHEATKTQKCHICEARMGQNLKRHLDTHFPRNRFKCNTCERPFNRKDHLEKHELTHQQVKPLECNFCDKSFTQISNLEVHIRAHTQEKPFKCDTCNKDFATSNDLFRHGRMHRRKMKTEMEAGDLDRIGLTLSIQ